MRGRYVQVVNNPLKYIDLTGRAAGLVRLAASAIEHDHDVCLPRPRHRYLRQRHFVLDRERSGHHHVVCCCPDECHGGLRPRRTDPHRDQLVVTIPPGAIIALEADPKVRYVERVGGTASDDETPLIGVPSDPRPGPATQTARFTPHALGSLAWDSGTYGYDGAGNIVSIGTDNYLYDGV